MTRLGIAMDLGTSGFRAQAVELSSGQIISTALTTRHPLPGVNVIDHIHFALELGVPAAQRLMMEAVNRVIGELGISLSDVDRCAVCGNPAQLSLFQGIEIRDLAYAGSRKLATLGVDVPARSAAVIAAQDLAGLKLPGRCEVIVPPAVRHEVGADALAMIIQSGVLARQETAILTDFGTNAEMALVHQGKVITGSTAAGPALEGQQITCGMLAAPGAISDLIAEAPYHRLILLDAEMLPVEGALIDLATDGVLDTTEGPRPIGITGTGTIAIIQQALAAGLIDLPRITTADGELHLGPQIYLTEKDLGEAGKAIGAVRAGHVTLCHEAGIQLEDIETAYMSGASGTYVDALKAQQLGLIPSGVQTIYQIGNTSLAMARDLVTRPESLDGMIELAHDLQATHCLFAASALFKQAYLLEYSYWTEGLPLSQYRQFLKRLGLPDVLPASGTPLIVRTVKRDIDDLGQRALTLISDIGRVSRLGIEGCVACLDCVRDCPGAALSSVAETQPPTLILTEALCNGVGCRRCERVCPEKVFDLNRFFREGRTLSS